MKSVRFLFSNKYRGESDQSQANASILFDQPKSGGPSLLEKVQGALIHLFSTVLSSVFSQIVAAGTHISVKPQAICDNNKSRG